MNKINNIKKDFNTKIDKMFQLKTISSEVSDIIDVFFTKYQDMFYDFNTTVNVMTILDFEVAYQNILTKLYEYHFNDIFDELICILRPYITEFDINLLKTPIGSLIVEHTLESPITESSPIISSTTTESTAHTFDPNKHLNFWINHILCRENESESEVINNIVTKVKNKLIWSNIISNIRIDDIRDALKKLKLSVYNKDCSLIFKLITKRTPWISDVMLSKLKIIFNKVLLELKKIDTNRKNKSCYLYYIYKILDIIITNEKEREILDFIYLQKSDTCYKNDIIWKKICENIPELKYKPTFR